MTASQARDLVRQFFRVLKAAGNEEIVLPPQLEEAKALLGAEAVQQIQNEVNAEE